jgi:uncharacterized damage-inducible protein DinB
MMNLGESYASRMAWLVKNINNNLAYIPDDRLTWKPAPTANSVLEIMNHLVAVIEFQTANIRGDEDTEFQNLNFVTREQAKESLQKAGDEYSQVVKSVSEEDWSREITLPFGVFSAALLGEIAVGDAMHHHGQITYIQTLLGDTETHILM